MLDRHYTAKATVRLQDAGQVVSAVCDHMREHDAKVSLNGDESTIYLGRVRAQFLVEGQVTRIDVVAPDLEELYFARLSVASHVLEFSGDDRPEIIWTGDGSDIVRPPNFQVLELVAASVITPNMRRLTFKAEDVSRFVGLNALHLNLLIQHPDAEEPQWPQVGANGAIFWSRPDLRPAMRKYTVRSIDIPSSTIAIDFVLHDDAGPGSSFARTAQNGDRVGVIGPGGGGLVDADWYLFAGDDTALPAIARMLEGLPIQATGKVFVEVANQQEIQQLRSPAAVNVEWLIRDPNVSVTLSPLVDAVRNTRFPDADQRVFVWLGCEYGPFSAIRAFVRAAPALQRAKHLMVSYWRQGRPEEE
jgi:NADPH-dependent ferric siderophore reductase